VRILHEYDLGGHHYSLIEQDDGSKIEIKGNDPIAVLAAMPTFVPAEPRTLEKTISEFSDDELTIEIERRVSLEETPETGIISRVYNWASGALGSALAYITGRG
jgi:hypothetical protein